MGALRTVQQSSACSSRVAGSWHPGSHGLAGTQLPGPAQLSLGGSSGWQLPAAGPALPAGHRGTRDALPAGHCGTRAAQGLACGCLPAVVGAATAAVGVAALGAVATPAKREGPTARSACSKRLRRGKTAGAAACKGRAASCHPEGGTHEKRCAPWSWFASNAPVLVAAIAAAAAALVVATAVAATVAAAVAAAAAAAIVVACSTGSEEFARHAPVREGTRHGCTAGGRAWQRVHPSSQPARRRQARQGGQVPRSPWAAPL